MPLLWDLYDPRTWDEIENRAAEDAWGAVAEDWPDNIPDDLDWYAGVLTWRFVMESSLTLPKWAWRDLERAKAVHQTAQAYYRKHVYAELCKALGDRMRATRRMPQPTAPPAYRPRTNTTPLDDWEISG